jgi:hypothetical protein
MNPQPRSNRSFGRAAFVATVVTAMLALVAMAGRAPLSRSSPINAVSVRAPGLAILLLIFAAGIAVVAAVVALVLPGYRRSTDQEPESVLQELTTPWIGKMIAIVAACAIAAVLVAAAALGTKTAHLPRQTIGAGLTGHLQNAPSRPSGSSSTFVVPAWLPWTMLVIVMIGVVVGAALMIGRREPLREESTKRTAAAVAVRAAIGELEGPDDARAAVITAYAAMERTFAASGVARSPAEAPREFLRRALVSARAGEREATMLTGLFEEARFSTHSISEHARIRALTALRALQSQMRDGRP